jgi:NADH:ubiquinone reductase (H+-translocating)
MMMTSLLVLVAIGAGLIALAIVFAWRVRPAVVHDHTSRRPRVVVGGGGFAGVYTAQYLEKLAGDRVEIVLVSPRNHFVFHPMLPEVISGSIGIMDVVSPIRRMLPRTELHVRTVEGIDFAARTVQTSTGFHSHTHAIPFDHLVLAMGSVTDFRGLRGLPEHAFPFKDLGDALRLRNHVIRVLEEAAVEHHDPSLRRRLLTFVVAGGGFSGVEVVAELNDFVRAVARHFRGIDPAELRVVLLHSQDRILPEMDSRLAGFAQRLLHKRGVEIRLDTRLAAATGQAAVLGDGTTLPTQTLVSTVPSSPHPLVDALPLPRTPQGRIEVEATLAVPGMPGVWALGDCARVPAPGGGVAPPTAQHAIRQARTLAENIVAALDHRPARPFAFHGLGKMGALGRHSAVAEVFGVRLSGFLAWFLWRTVYLMKLPGWGRRLKVAVAWTLDLILPPELVQLEAQGSTGIVREHFEPGQEVFEQGDVGDRVYVVLSGAAEVVRDGQQVAALGRGDYFGEMAVLGGAQRNATVRCTDAMDVLVLPRREFAMLSGSLPELRQSFEATAGGRARTIGSR